jgi:multidrug efflux pump
MNPTAHPSHATRPPTRSAVDPTLIAAAVALVLIAIGAAVALLLPIGKAPPRVLVTTVFPGADGITVENAVAAPIEQQINSLPDVTGSTSSCGDDGSYRLTLFFAHEMDPDSAQELVQRAVSLAMPQLPQAVQSQGIRVEKKTSAFP